ncbi:MAG: site-2 protease family protein [Solirubrobacteraceae bacterium]|nr:site-2 protease family protein [Patulibacter sp.]
MTDGPGRRPRRNRPDPFAPRERFDPFLPQPAAPPDPEPTPVPEPEPVRPDPLWSARDVDYDQPLPPPQIPGAEEQAKDKVKRFGGPLGFLLLAAWKVGRIVLVALGKVAVLFKIPVFGSVLSGAVSIGAYAVFYGWTFAIGLVGSLLVHELGHVVALKREGMPVKALNFVPFLGAYVMSDRARTLDQQARISIAGPIAGAALALVLFYAVPDDPAIRAVAYTGFFLNLINLLPLPPLDGGGVGRIFPSAWWLMLVPALAAVWALSGEEFAAVAAGAALLMAYLRREGGWAVDPADGIDVRHRIQAAVLYVGVIAVCAFGLAATFENRTDDLVRTYGSAPAAVTAAVGVPAPVR